MSKRTKHPPSNLQRTYSMATSPAIIPYTPLYKVTQPLCLQTKDDLSCLSSLDLFQFSFLRLTTSREKGPERGNPIAIDRLVLLSLFSVRRVHKKLVWVPPLCLSFVCWCESQFPEQSDCRHIVFVCSLTQQTRLFGCLERTGTEHEKEKNVRVHAD